jgi:hypothetical protein
MRTRRIRRKMQNLTKAHIALLVYFALVAAIIITCYFLLIHKTASPQFRELTKQEKALDLPKPSRIDSSDAGCKTYEIDGYECSRHLDLLFEDTSVRPAIQRSLARNGWTHRKVPNPDRDLPADSKVRFETYDMYTKGSPTGDLCAELETNFNANYKPSGPWSVSLNMFDETTNCKSYVSYPVL